MKHLLKIQSEFLKYCKDDLSGSLHEEWEERITLGKLPTECSKIKPIIIKQGIVKEIKKDGNLICYIRLRMKKEPGKKPEYSFGVKHFPLRQESEAEVSKSIFNCFYPDNLKKPQEKKRYKLKNGWEVDDIDKGGIVAEYERKKNEKVKIPDNFNVIK